MSPDIVSPAPLSGTSASSPKAKILLVDDHPIVRQGLANLIDATADLRVSGEASSAAEALAAIAADPPDVAVIDISLEDRNGVELIKDIVARHPAVKCLALSMYDESMYAMRVLKAGGRGYIMKQTVAKHIVSAIHRVRAGHTYVSDQMATRLVDQMVLPAGGHPPPMAEITDRELEILTLLGRGQSTRAIADMLFLSIKTVEAHRERIKEKLKLKSGTELLRYAVQYTLDHPGK
ncbi:MAG TPA: response regulator transcription factor [Tepidisphaeraceae bacterium]|jgi:DNA-binding NarL/FixJ family response regulator|nr:response regulator transcription factor [Tepidisphaeraceae bacterium]